MFRYLFSQMDLCMEVLLVVEHVHAVLFPLSDSANWLTLTTPVGMWVNSVCCEIEGIILGMEVATTYLSQCSSRNPTEYVYVFCDCLEAVETIVNKLESHKYPNIAKKLLCIEN